MVLLHVAFPASDRTDDKLISEFRTHPHPWTEIEQFSAVMFGRLATPAVRKLFGV